MRFSTLAACFGTATSLRVATDIGVNDTEGLEGGNLCMMGRLAPKFFLLGTPKGGTTAFYEDFARSDQIINYQPVQGEEEWHSKEPWVFANGFDVSHRKKWLSHYPNCRQDQHMVAVDCTPGYFGSEKAPFAIHKAYGSAKHQLVFMVFLREPVGRAHSHYYQFQENGVLQGYFGDCSPQQFPKSFQHAVTNRLFKGAVCNCGCDTIMDDSMYKDSFKRYFKNFPPSSFHVVPFKKAVSSEVVDYTWKLLNVPKGHGEKGNLVGGDNAQNHHEYPKLEADLPAPLMKQFEIFMHTASGPGPVAKVLAGSGAHLYGYEGAGGDEGSVASWLAGNW